MTTHEMAAGFVLLTGVAATGIAAFRPLLPAEPVSAVSTDAGRTQPLPRYSHDSLAPVVVDRDLFRATRRRASVAYDPRAGAPPLVHISRPALRVVGIVAGTPPSAVIEGLPGVEGSRVLRQGDVLGELRVETIGAEVVKIVGMDTTWVLRVREPWHH